MKASFLIIPENAKFSPAVMHLAGLLRTAKSHCSNKDELINYLTKEIDGKSFSRAEATRIYVALHKVQYFWEGENIPGMTGAVHFTFRREQYSGNSNFFEEYSRDLLWFGEVVKPTGRPKGFTSPAIKEHCAQMRAAKKAKANPSQLIYDERTGDFVPQGQLESPVVPVNPLEDKLSEIDAQIARLNEEREAIKRFRAAQEKLQLICDTAEMSAEQLLELINFVAKGI